MKLKSWHIEAVRAALIVGLTLLTMGACQSIPTKWRIGLSGAAKAALGCIDEDDRSLPRHQRVARCTSRILVEAGEVADAISEADQPASDAAPVSKSTPASKAPPASQTAPTSQAAPASQAASASKAAPTSEPAPSEAPSSAAGSSPQGGPGAATRAARDESPQDANQ